MHLIALTARTMCFVISSDVSDYLYLDASITNSSLGIRVVIRLDLH